MSGLSVEESKLHLAVKLRDGMLITVRPIRPADAPQLQSMYARLSPATAFFRFMACWKELTLERAEYLTQIDYRTRMAFVAVRATIAPEQIIGLASYASISSQTEGIAEAAVVVVDQYQRLGLGTIMLKHLARFAWEKQIHTFVGIVHVENRQILRWLERLDFRIGVEQPTDEASDLQVYVDLSSTI